MMVKNKKLYVKKFLVGLVIVAVLSLTVYFLSLKSDALFFAFTNTEQVRYAKERYELVHKQADKQFMEVMASPLQAK